MCTCTRDYEVEWAREWARAVVPTAPMLAETMAGRVLIAAPPWQAQRLALAGHAWLRLVRSRRHAPCVDGREG